MRAHGAEVDEPVGVVHKKDLLDSLLDNGEFNIERLVQTPAFIPQSTSVLKALEKIAKRPRNMWRYRELMPLFEKCTAEEPEPQPKPKPKPRPASTAPSP